MISVRIEGANVDFGKPPDWDDESGHCATLAVKHAIVGGHHVLISAWEPTPEELVKLNAGETIKLMIYSKSHPVVSIIVGEGK
jgi:hypothetical protein